MQNKFLALVCPFMASCSHRGEDVLRDLQKFIFHLFVEKYYERWVEDAEWSLEHDNFAVRSEIFFVNEKFLSVAVIQTHNLFWPVDQHSFLFICLKTYVFL